MMRDIFMQRSDEYQVLGYTNTAALLAGVKS
jgi:hypothetical protein